MIDTQIFSLAHLAAAVYIPLGGYILNLRTGRKGSPARLPFVAHRRGRSLRNKHVPNL